MQEPMLDSLMQSRLLLRFRALARSYGRAGLRPGHRDCVPNLPTHRIDESQTSLNSQLLFARYIFMHASVSCKLHIPNSEEIGARPDPRASSSIPWCPQLRLITYGPLSHAPGNRRSSVPRPKGRRVRGFQGQAAQSPHAWAIHATKTLKPTSGAQLVEWTP